MAPPILRRIGHRRRQSRRATKPRRQEFIAFLEQIVAPTPGRVLHRTRPGSPVLDRGKPGMHVLTPTSGSWLNLVEAWFVNIERPAIRRGTRTAVTDLDTQMRASVTGWNKRG